MVFIYLISTSLNGNPIYFLPGGNSGFRNEFYWLAVNMKPFHYTGVYLQWSLKNSSTVNQREFMHSPDFVSSSQQTQFEYPRHQHSETTLCIHVGLSFTNMSDLCFLCQSIRNGCRCLYMRVLGKKDKEKGTLENLVYKGDRKKLIFLNDQKVLSSISSS